MAGGGTAHLLDFVVDRLEVGIFAIDAEMRLVLWNRFMANHSGMSAEEVIGRPLFECFPELPQKWLEKKIRNVFLLKNYAFTSWEQRPYLFRFGHNRPITGGVDAMQQSCTFLPVKDAADNVEHVCVTIFDYTDSAIFQQRLSSTIAELESKREEQRHLIVRLEDAQSQLLQSEKLASIGQLAAGVAHEINNPVGFVNSNMGALEHYVQGMLRLLDAYGAGDSAGANGTPSQEISSLKKELDFEFMREDVASLIQESKDGLERVKKIVQDLKDFSHVDSTLEWQLADLHKCLDSTLNVATNEIKHKADVVKTYGQLPEVECLPSQLNQVFLNLMVNAAHAITVGHGTITLATGSEGDWVWVAVSDSGCGIPPENLKRIFDPFFTTKPVGKGTGLGLSVSYSVIAKHGGRIEVESEIGKGTTFRVWLPLRHPQDVPA